LLIMDSCFLKFSDRSLLFSLARYLSMQLSTTRGACLLLDFSEIDHKSPNVPTRSSLMQAHCRRISDFLVLGENVWWYCIDGHICFLDGPEITNLQTCVPHLPELKIANKINGRFLGNE
jgi:hypothetical protein